METKPETQDVEVEEGEWVAHRDPCLQPAASTLLLSGDTGGSLAGSSYLESRQAVSRQALGGSTLFGVLLFQAIFKPHVSTSAFALQMCF